ncbi:TetR/AcrR family transcriptional regulator [Actinokineospora pegani]|uniref:TetR/AcrR family transcriptional regulator n=1 Tax=Actinokineospora pegani TaxID=2654637 RepID=UPI001F181FB9|nr:TetR family transcriptional regulator [Actinokineospora pegani]
MVTDVGRTQRAGQVDATRQRLLDTAERLFAELGLAAVSNRQISAAAGQGNNAAVGYHFGAKADLVRAIIERRTATIEAIRESMVERVRGSRDLRDWVNCLVRPVTAHLDSLGGPTWFARFGAQVTADPAFRSMSAEVALATPSLRTVLDGLDACLADLPEDVRRTRWDMVRLLMTHGCAEREQALADGGLTTGADWDAAATGMVDALVGLLRAPVTPQD